MKIFPVTVIRRTVVNIIQGAANWLGQTKPAVSLGLTLRAIIGDQRPAPKQTMAPSTLIVPEKPAIVQGFSPATLLVGDQRPAPKVVPAGTLVVVEAPAPRADISAASAFKVLEVDAERIARVQFDLEHKSFVVAMTNDTGNTDNWANPTNAQGANNGTFASWAKALDIISTGKMHGTTVAQPSRPASLAIQSVWLAVWSDWSGFPIVDSILSQGTVGYRIGGITAADKVTHTQTGAAGSWTGTEVRIDNGAGAFTDALGTAVTWANIALLQFFAAASAIVAVLPTYRIDALRLRVVAAETWVP